jgi:DNA-binding transcriptional LysR family regulator
VAFVCGVTPDKWVRTWRQRFPRSPLETVPVGQPEQLTLLRTGQVRMSFVRLPVDREGLHLIPLYRERPVVVVSREHPVAAYDEIDVADLADEHLLHEPADLRLAVETVAADAGVLILPMSVARTQHRKDVRAVPVTGVAETQVGLAWPVADDDPRIERFIGVVRGRTERSTRGAEPPSPRRRTGRRR